MNPYFMPSVCDNCDEKVVITPRSVGEQWRGAKIVHKDTQICVDILKAKLEKQKKVAA